MEELKTRSFRISEEVSDKLKAICTEFDNQNSALDSLIKAYEIQKAKSVIIDRQAEVSDLDTHLQAIQTAFLRSLELNENAEQRIRADFRSLLDSKDEIIIQLQSDNAQLQEQAGQSETAYNALRQATDEEIKSMQGKVLESEKTAQNAQERATEAIKAREQAEKISAMTMEQVEQLKEQVSALTAKAEQSDSYKNKFNAAEKQIAELTTKLSSAENELEQAKIRYQHDTEVAIKGAIADTREQYQGKIEQSQTKVSQLQSKIEQLQVKVEQLLNEISELKTAKLTVSGKK